MPPTPSTEWGGVERMRGQRAVGETPVHRGARKHSRSSAEALKCGHLICPLQEQRMLLDWGPFLLPISDSFVHCRPRLLAPPDE